MNWYHYIVNKSLSKQLSTCGSRYRVTPSIKCCYNNSFNKALLLHYQPYDLSFTIGTPPPQSCTILYIINRIPHLSCCKNYFFSCMSALFTNPFFLSYIFKLFLFFLFHCIFNSAFFPLLSKMSLTVWLTSRAGFNSYLIFVFVATCF